MSQGSDTRDFLVVTCPDAAHQRWVDTILLKHLDTDRNQSDVVTLPGAVHCDFRSATIAAALALFAVHVFERGVMILVPASCGMFEHQPQVTEDQQHQACALRDALTVALAEAGYRDVPINVLLAVTASTARPMDIHDQGIG